jgi:hypothetical protein
MPPRTPSFDDDDKPDTKKDDTPDLESRIRELERNLAAASRGGIPLNTIPLHGAGPGSDIAETWSQADQEAARAEE